MLPSPSAISPLRHFARRWLWPLRFILILLIPLSLLDAIRFGRSSGMPNLFAYWPLFVNYVVLTAIVMTGTVMVSYTRARAENTIPRCKVGFLERPERVVLVILGALFDRMAPVLWILAIFSNMAVISRMMFTWQECQKLDKKSL